ncbi:MAG: hypothetical protein E7618_08195 [Ruminococcaceae bacterium]|nr:hypothetical protein [Oscillospiraceae bacterium]
MKFLTLEEHRARIENLREVRKNIKTHTRELRIHNYLPGQIIYYLGDYPAKMSITPTEYDFNLLKSYAEHGVDMIQVHEEWNDTIERYGSDKYRSCDHEGMLKFVDLCHYFGIKIIPYCSSSYIHEGSKHYHENFSRGTGGCVDMHYKYRFGWAGSEYWRNFILPRTFNILDTYGFDGIFNDWGYDWEASDYIDIPENRRNNDSQQFTRFDPEAEDFIHMLYDGIKLRGGIYKMHIGGYNSAPVRWKCYDYLWVGECNFSAEYGGGKMLEPYLVPCPDKPRLTNWGTERFDADAYFALTIPFVQFPLLTHGRPTMGRCIDVPGVTQYNTTQEDHLYHYFEKVRDFADAHPSGPYIYSEWSQIPDDVEDYPRWCRYLELYKGMTEEQTVVFMEIRETEDILSAIPHHVFVTEFVNENRYMVVSNMTDTPYTVTLRDCWQNRETGEVSTSFIVPVHRILFLKKATGSVFEEVK